MASVTVDLRNVEGTEAAMGWAGAHTIVVDRPEGKAGGMGLGFNGAELLGLSLGGCFCNDLRYVAHERGIALGAISVRVKLELGGEPLVVTAATMEVDCETEDGSDPARLIEESEARCTISHTLRRGLPVAICRVLGTRE